MADKTFKLPLFSKTERMEPVPGQDAGRVFMITDALRPQPEKGFGYLVEAIGPRLVKVVAWLAFGGAIYECDEPLAALPEEGSVAGISKDGDGGIFFYMRIEGRIVKVARFSQREGDGRLAVVSSVGDLGPYGVGAHGVREMGSACFLSLWAFPHERGEFTSFLTVGDILDGLLESSYPDALDALVYRGARSHASGFDRFASRSLLSAGAERVRPIAARHDIGLRRLRSTGLFWTACDKKELDASEVDVLQSVEGALNRLVFMERRLGDGLSPVADALSEGVCERAALESLTSFAAVAEGMMRGCDRPNDFRNVLGAQSLRGGEWDLRTRFASAAEGLCAPFGFDYRFDCDARSGVLSVEATVPASGAFPFEGDAARGKARDVYLLRLAAALAAIAFGSGVGVIRAVVTMRERSLDGRVVASLAFARRDFAMGVLPGMPSGAILDDSLDADGLLGRLAPEEARMCATGDGDSGSVEPIEADVPDRSIDVVGDHRPLPSALAGPLRADVVSDLDIYDTGDDPLRNRYREICERHREDAGRGEGLSPSVAGELLDLISAYDAADALRDGDARPLYCANMVSRVVVSRIDEGEQTRYRKLPDTAFDARAVLCRLYRDMGNVEDAIRLGEELVKLAPTTFSSYHLLAMAYREAGRDGDAIAALLGALRIAADPTDIACAYYRLGFLFWQTGDPSLGLACYAMVNPGSYFFGEAQLEVKELMQESRLGRRPTREEAIAALRTDGVPIAPLPQLCELVARSAIALVDAGMFRPAAPLVQFLATVDVAPNSFDVLASVCRSLRGRR